MGMHISSENCAHTSCFESIPLATPKSAPGRRFQLVDTKLHVRLRPETESVVHAGRVHSLPTGVDACRNSIARRISRAGQLIQRLDLIRDTIFETPFVQENLSPFA